MPATILIADDHDSSRMGLEALLSLEGYNVLIAEDGIQALEQFRRTQPDLLVLDINMPNMRGTEVCRRIKNNPETLLVPVVLITGLTATEDRVIGIQAGADDFLCKPVDREQLAEAVLFALARSIEEKDPYTEGHCARLAEYSTRLGEHIGLSAPEIKALRRAGVVHDIGKVAVPDTILLKPARLTRTEQLILWRHPVIGERICSPLKSFQMVLPIIRHHHEKMNGSGYPDGLQGEDIPITARVLTIVDVYDALTTERPYKKALGEDQALAVIKKEVKKGWWDPRLFDAFHEMMQIKLPDNLAAQAAAAAAD